MVDQNQFSVSNVVKIQQPEEPFSVRAQEEPQTSRQRLWGAITLVLIFFASAGFTISYLSNTALYPINPQTAAASTIASPFLGISLTAESAFVLDLTTNQILYALNPDAQLPLASLTKVPLALVVSEVLEPNSIITIVPHDTPDGSPIRLPAGLQLRAQDLLDFMLVVSSNEGAELLSDAAETNLRRAYPETDQSDVTLWRMNNLVKNLGLTHTYFRNIHGLDMSATQAGAYGSARDIAHLFGFVASTAPAIFERTSRENISINTLSGQVITAVNTDQALSAIPGLILGKTGFTDLAGGNLAIVFEVGPAHPVVAVILRGTQEGRFDDMKKLVAATQASIAKDR